MTHPDEDALLQYFLQTLEESDTTSIAEHLSQCAECRVHGLRIQEEIGRIGNVQIAIAPPRILRIPVPSTSTGQRWRWVAGIAAGFLLGIFTAHLVDVSHPDAVPQRVITKAAPSSLSGYMPCKAQDLRVVFKP